jgi:hypothetical protein
MKKSPLLTSIFLLLTISFLACKKESPAPEPTEPTPKTIEQLMTAHAWKLQEARFLQNNSITYYNRGVTSNGNIYDKDSIRFNINNTGTYYNSGGSSNLTWSFLDAGKTKLRIIYPINGFTVNWENVHVTDSAFRYAEYYTIPESTILSMGAFYRTPR